jgi:replicative DNA helicase
MVVVKDMYDEEIEKAILYYIVFADEDFDLSEEDFINETHKKIIKAILELKTKKEQISILTINNKIKNNDGIIDYIANLGEYVSYTNPEKIYEILKQYTKKRQVFNISKKIQQSVKETENIDVYIEKVINALKKIELQTEKDESFVSQVINTAELIEKNKNKKEDYSLYTGYFDLDGLTDGLHNGELTVIGARPGVGKTTFTLQLAENIAKKGKCVAYISLEMSEVQMIQKLLSMRTRINSRKIRNGNLDEKEIEKINEECISLSDLKFNLLTKINTIQQIEIMARRLKNKNELDLLIIDYLQLVKNAGGFRSREQEVADMSRTLKLLSLELDIPIIALCQLNRNASREKPTLADIRESGAIEQDADNVIFLYQENQNNDIITVDLQKQRAGNIGSLELNFIKNISEFRNIVR